ncbi:MAG: hypothetical protein ABH845_01340 [Candidatus Omnitrophota bacterium]
MTGLRSAAVETTLAAALIFLAPGTLRADSFRDHLLSRIEQKSLNVQSYKASFDLWVRAGEEEFSLVGTTLYKRPKMLRVEMVLRDEKGLNQVLYQKGGLVWQYLPSAKVAFRRQEDVLREKFPDAFASQDLLNIQNPFDLVESGTVKFIDEEQVSGETTYLFEGVPKKAIRYQGFLSPALCRMRVADQDGLLRDLVMYDGAGVEIMKQHFWDIQLNLELLEEEFDFRPEDVKLIEVTKHTIKKMELLMQGGGLP